jgi:hypothetical protein
MSDFEKLIKISIDGEAELLEIAKNKYEEFYSNTANLLELLNNFLVKANAEHWIFLLYLSQIRKHAMLAFLSSIRKHHVQTKLNMRIVYEAGFKAAYAVAFHEESKFFKYNDEGLVIEPKHYSKLMYNWLEENYPEGVKPLGNLKSIINESAAHASLVYSYQYTTIDIKNRKSEYTFFDNEDLYLTQADIWEVGNGILGILDLIYGVNEGLDSVFFSEGFLRDIQEHGQVNKRLRIKMMEHERYKKVNNY